MAAAATQAPARIAGIGAAISLALILGLTRQPARAAYPSAVFAVSATVLSACQVSLNPYISEALAGNAASAVQVKCSAQTSYRIAAEPASPVSARLAGTPGPSAAASATVLPTSASAAPTASQSPASANAAEGDRILTVQY